MGNPAATTREKISDVAQGEFAMWFSDRKNRRTIPHRFEKCGYVPVRNDGARDGLWVINGNRQVIYAKKDLPLSDQINAAELLRQSQAIASAARAAANPSQ